MTAGAASLAERVRALILERDDIAELDPAARRLELRDLVTRVAGDNDLGRSVAEIADAIDGWGPLTAIMDDDAVTDVLVNGCDEIWVDRGAGPQRADVRFADDASVRGFADRLISSAGGRLDPSHPIADARTHDGSRIHAVIPPVSARPLVSVRRFRRGAASLEDLAARGMFDARTGDVLTRLVHDRKNLVISGGTGSGKTTLMNALLGAVPPEQRVVIVEETPELRPACAHVVSLKTRYANVDGNGGVTLATLVRASLRMRPDRIVVGEVRGAEAFVALTAMVTGHAGSMLTVHAGAAAEALQRLVMLSLQEGGGATENAIALLAEMAVDAVIHVERTPEGRRKVACVDLLR